MSRKEIVRKIGKLYRGEHLDLPEVVWTRGAEVRLRSPQRVLLEMDGELPGTLEADFPRREGGACPCCSALQTAEPDRVRSARLPAMPACPPTFPPAA